ncbi:putative sulfate exporter family transporter [Actinomadura luzonensis]|uniref:putative sulfate exporter family transporter n=1 Tax=Actinomadura luzonensis TaxID=2805427 RepID=UPI0020C75DE3|nr:putative sulfate exporter family transporter [Actinomadura luzonensis]
MRLPPARLAVWTGAAVHEVAQVAAIGAATGVLAAAVTVKLARVILLAPMVALTAWARRRASPAGAGDVAAGRPAVLPLFVAAFLGLAALRGTGWVPGPVTAVVPQVTGVLTAAALFGLGTGIDVRKLARGGRVLLLGGFASTLVAGISLAGAMLFV